MNATIQLLRKKAELTIKSNQYLINEIEVLDLLEIEFPKISIDLKKTDKSNNIYTAMQCYSNFTKQLIKKGDFKEVKHCFIIAEKMLENGNSAVKNAIENCYLFSLSTILDFSNPLSNKIKSLLTNSLKKGYNKQVCSSGV